MKTLKLFAVMMTICTLSIVTSSAQDLVAFKVSDSARPFVFILRLPSQDGASEHSTNATPPGVLKGYRRYWPRDSKPHGTREALLSLSSMPSSAELSASRKRNRAAQ